MTLDELHCLSMEMEGSFDVEEDSSELMVRVELQMEWFVPAGQLIGDAGRGKDTWQALQEREEVGRARVKQDGRCLLVWSSLEIWSNLPSALL